MTWFWPGVLRHPNAAFAAAAGRSVRWGAAIVVTFNLSVVVTTVLTLALRGDVPRPPPPILFVPLEHFYWAELAFLVPLRVAVWVLGAALIHAGLRLVGRPGGFRLALNLYGVVYVAVMPFVLVLDWAALGLGVYHQASFRMAHGLLALALTLRYGVIGVRRLFGVGWPMALVLVAVSEVVTAVPLALMAR